MSVIYWAGTMIPMSENSAAIMKSGICPHDVDMSVLRERDKVLAASNKPALEHYKAIYCDKALDTWAHLPFLRESAKGNILEIGVHCGVSTTALLAGLEENGGHLWSVDTHPACRYVWYGHPQWTFFCPWSGDKVEPNLPLDLLFIDGDHSYEWVMRDLSTWLPEVKAGGMVLLHDADTASFPGVRRAIDEYCSEHKLTHELRKGSHGLEVIYV